MTHKPIEELGINLARFGDSPQSLEAALKVIAELQAKNEALELEVERLKGKASKCEKCGKKSMTRWEYCACCGYGGDPVEIEAQAAAMRQALETLKEKHFGSWIGVGNITKLHCDVGCSRYDDEECDCGGEVLEKALDNAAGKELLDLKKWADEYSSLLEGYCFCDECEGPKTVCAFCELKALQGKGE